MSDNNSLVNVATVVDKHVQHVGVCGTDLVTSDYIVDTIEQYQKALFQMTHDDVLFSHKDFINGKTVAKLEKFLLE